MDLLNISSTYTGTVAIQAAVESFRQSEQMLLNAVKAVNRGDILDAMILANQAKITAKSGAAIARVANEVSKTIIDLIA